MSGSVLNQVFSLFYQNNQSQLGLLFLDVLTNEQINLPTKVTQYPIETGDGDITDHITANNEELTINGAISATTTWGFEFGPLCYSKLVNAIDQLRTMQASRAMFSVVTGLGKYDNMGFTTLTVSRSNTNPGGQWLQVNATLRKIKLVSLKQATLPPDKAAPSAKGKAGDTKKPTGQANPDDSASRSPLANGFKANGIKGGQYGLDPLGPQAPVRPATLP